ncbi:MAG TPA: ABC transporter ATP-binding protein [Planctomycetota bacterium]|nr:ABC transporter ATP-binding protein [Planctomycetota bacterium]
MIEIESLVKTYSGGTIATEVLKGISFRVAAGEYVALMGASGTGKSTLMNILGCLDTPTGGRYRLDGEDVAGLDDDALSRLRNRKIGFVFQQFHLLDRAPAIRNVMLPLIYSEEDVPDALERAGQALEAVGLGDRKQYRPGQLSGGQQQRVAIARALVTRPALLLADEPTGNLDAQNGAEVLSVFRRLHGEGKTILLVTHDRAVADHARRVIVLGEGRIVEDRAVAS